MVLQGYLNMIDILKILESMEKIHEIKANFIGDIGESAFEQFASNSRSNLPASQP